MENDSFWGWMRSAVWLFPRCVVLVAIVGLVGLSPAARGAGKEEKRPLDGVRNGTFADGVVGWRLCPLSAVKEVAGGNALVIKDTKRNGGSDIISQAIPVRSESPYTLSAKLKYTGDQTGLVYVRCHGRKGRVGRDWAILDTGKRKAGEWHQISADLMFPAAVETVRLWIHSSNGSVGEYVLDNLSLSVREHNGGVVRFKKAATGHPRVFLREEKLKQIRRNIANDPNAKRVAEIIIAQADKLLAEKPITYVRKGRRMLQPARETLDRIKQLGMAYHLTGETKYADAGAKVTLAATAIPDWNPRHYLDTAILSLAVGLGYDWFFDKLTTDQRKSVVRAIVEKGIKPSWNRRPWWVTGKSNWNQVCNGGLGIAALAIWDEVPQIAAMTLERSVAGIPHTMATYAPDGIYLEGPSYWAFGTTYTVKFIHALEDVLGTDYGLSESPGFLSSIDAINFLTGPTRLFLNFSDGYRYRYSQAVSYWFAQHRGDPNLLFLENGLLERCLERESGTDFVMTLIWSNEAQRAQAPARLHWHGKGEQPIASFRSSWEKDATFAAMKGGISGMGHGHMDVGGFVIDADGVRWASDAPSQTYDLEENARRKAKAEGKPFERAFYRERWSHNILVVDGKKPVPGSRSPMCDVSEASDNPYAIFDLAPAYKGQLAQAKRGLWLRRDKSVIVQDEFVTLDKAQTQIRWAMLTLNSPEIDNKSVSQDGKRLSLTRKGKGTAKSPTMHLEILSPSSARFEVLVTNDQPYIHYYDKISDDARQVVINLEVPAKTKQTLTVHFRPGSIPAGSGNPVVIPLDQWGKGLE